MTDPSLATLFEPADGDDGRFFLVTNRYNLLEFLSAGYVLPAAGIPKYYTDLLAHAQGRLPLLRAPLGGSIATEVSSEDPTAFPVALEVEDSLARSTSAPLLRRDGTPSSGVPDVMTVALAPSGLLPLSGVARVHFRSFEELEEHRAREYENVPKEQIEFVVSPGLFSGESVDFGRLRAFLQALEPAEALTSAFLDGLDRRSGAKAMLVAASPPEVVPLRAVATLLAGKPSSEERVPSWLQAAVLDDPPESLSADETLYAVAADVFRMKDRAAAWRPLEILARIEEGLGSVKLSKRDEVVISKNLRPIGAILRNERDLKPFEPDSGLPAAKALLLALLRPDPDRLLSWDRRETGADDPVLLGAAALVGLLRGHKKLPLELRSAGLDRLLAERAARAAARVVADAMPMPTGGDALNVEESLTDEGDTMVRIMWGDVVVVEKTRPAPTTTERMLKLDLADPSVHALALLICRTMGWPECVTTTITVSSGTFAVDAETNSVSITTAGLVDPMYSVNQDAFRGRLEVEGLPPDLEASVRAGLRGQ